MSAINSIQILYPISGFVVGLLVGLTGVGGGSLMTPLLILLFGIHPATAVGTDLLYAAATKSVGGDRARPESALSIGVWFGVWRQAACR